MFSFYTTHMTASTSFKFTKNERLCGDIKINTLFTKGKAFISYPFRIVYTEVEYNNTLAQILISVPKRRFKKAVKRIRLKRQIREAYRLNKSSLESYLKEKEIAMHIGYTYISNDELPYKEIEKGIIDSFKKLKKELG